MRKRGVGLLVSIALIATAMNALCAEQNWAGEYANKNFLDGQAVFEFSIQQSPAGIKISFDAAYNDAHGAAPDGKGQARMTRKNMLEFKWEDSFENSGTGTIMRSGGGITVSMKTTHVVDSRCLVFYDQNMRFKRAK